MPEEPIKEEKAVEAVQLSVVQETSIVDQQISEFEAQDEPLQPETIQTVVLNGPDNLKDQASV